MDGQDREARRRSGVQRGQTVLAWRSLFLPSEEHVIPVCGPGHGVRQRMSVLDAFTDDREAGHPGVCLDAGLRLDRMVQERRSLPLCFGKGQ